MTQWLELRIHGVHGTTPAALLGVAEVQQVAGDGLTGVYRAPAGTELPYRKPDPNVVVEAYSWGALTSGVAGVLGWLKRVLWLLLLPFALANLAYWARLTVAQDDARARFTSAAVRLSALVLTIFFVLTPLFIGVDLFAWQCFRAGVPACPPLPGWTQSLAALSPGIRLAIGMQLPLATVGVLWGLSRSTLARYEATDDPSSTQTWDERPDAVLSRAGLWSGTRRTSTLRALHVAAALATVTVVVAGHAWRSGHVIGATGWSIGFAAVGIVAALVLVAAAASCLLDVDGPGGVRRPRLLALGALACVVVLLAMLVLAPRSAFDQYLDFAWHDEEFVLVFVILTILHLCVFFADRITTRWWLPPIATLVLVGGGALLTFLHHGPDVTSPVVATAMAVLFVVGSAVTYWHFRGSPRTAHASRAWNGAGASVMLAAAAWVALLFTTTAVTATANYLNGDQSVARLTTGVEPYGTVSPTPGQLRRLTVSGPVKIRSLTVPGAGRAFEVTAASAWLTPGGAGDADPLRFQVRGGLLHGARIRFPAGTKVDDVTSGRLVILGRAQTLAARSVDLVLTDPGHTALVLPPVLIWSPIAQLVWLLAAAGVLLLCWLRFARRVGRRISAPRAADGVDLFVSKDFRSSTVAGVPTWRVAERDRAPVVSARVGAAFSHRAEQLLNYTGAITAPIALVLVGLSSTDDYVNLGRSSSTWNHVLGYAANVSLYAILGVSAALLALGAKVRASEGWRKNVGILWDLTTFWPRAAHPLAPPCYAERVIPELLTRIAWVRESGTERIVVSAHSQGSLIAVSTLMRVPDLAGIHLVTYGSQVRGLYGRVFPSVFGPDTIPYAATTGPTLLGSAFPDVDDPDPRSGGTAVAGPARQSHLATLVDEGRWVNLFRRADPLGFRVFSDAIDDASDRVVMEVPVSAYGDTGPAVLGHSNYQHSPEYRALISAWTSTPWVGPPASPQEVEPLPPE